MVQGAVLRVQPPVEQGGGRLSTKPSSHSPLTETLPGDESLDEQQGEQDPWQLAQTARKAATWRAA